MSKCECGETKRNEDDICKYCQAEKWIFFAGNFICSIKDLGVCPRIAEKTHDIYLHLSNKKNKAMDTFLKESFGKSVFLSGKAGTGKTIQAVTWLIDHYVKHNSQKKHWDRLATYGFLTCYDLAFLIKDSYSNKTSSELTILQKFRNFDYLVIDDIGVEIDSDWFFAILYSIINYRFESGKKTAYTSNFNIEELAKKFGDERITRRIYEDCSIIELT